MSLRVLGILYRKEMTDLLRDRRTIISLIIAPVLVGPLISGGMGYFMERSRTRAKVERYSVGIREAVVVPGLSAALTQAGLDVRTVGRPRDAVESKAVTFGVEVAGSEQKPEITFYSDNSEVLASMARGRVNEALDKLAKQKVRAELQRRNVPESVIEPFTRKSVNVAQARKMTGSIVGMMVGFLLLIFLFNGAMYSAVDATAGEKERKTLEMLLSSAASRVDIVLAKVGVALTTAFATAVLSMLSYAIAFSRYRSMPGMSNMEFPTDLGTLILLALLILPIAVLAAAAGVAAATPAKSTREAMSYLTPGFLIVIVLGMVTFVPDLASQPFIAVVPFSNFSKMLREVLQGEWSWSQYAITLVANLAYAALAVGTAVRNFQRENILFRT
jgi:sodium transport system permease protein